MTSRDFCFWLQGFFELGSNGKPITDSLNPWQTREIKKHLALVFVHEIDPSFGDKKKQDILNALHNPIDPIMRC